MLFLGKTDFFPAPLSEQELSRAAEICLGTKSLALGDALALTTLPERLREKHPGLRIRAYSRGFNRVVFRGNPHVAGLTRFPRVLHGDDSNFGSGQLIEQKERYFGLEPSSDPRPRIYLSEKERARAQALLSERLLPGNEKKPLCVLHPWGSSRNRVLAVEDWDAIVRRWEHKFRFWQVGIEGHGAVQGCEFYFLTPPSRRAARGMFALIEQARAFVGVDSGPMHVARAFGVPSLIYLDHLTPEDKLETIFERRARGEPYFVHGNWRYSPLYAANRHVAVDRITPKEWVRDTDAFFEVCD